MNLEEPITITVERTGGFAGIPRRWSVSSESLDEGEKKKLRELLEESKIFDYAAPAGSPEPDRFGYTVTVQGAMQSRTVKLEESTLPEAIRSLLVWIQSRRPPETT